MTKICKIMTVGTGIAGSDSNVGQGLVNVIRLTRPAALCLVPSSSEDSRELADLVAEEVAGDADAPVLVRGEDGAFPRLSEHDDIWQCRRELVAVITRCQEAHPDHRILLNPTSGTKQMSAAGVLAALDTALDELEFIAGDRANGLVSTGTERPLAFSARAYLAEKAAPAAVAAIRAGAWTVARQTLAPYADEMPGLLALADALGARDRFDYNGALKAISNRRDDARFAGLRQSLETLKDALAAANREEPLALELLVDLILSARRRLAWGQPEEALARVYRAAEMAGKLALGDYNILPPYELAMISGNPGLQARVVANWRRNKPEHVAPLMLHLRDVYTLLRAAGDDLGRFLNPDTERRLQSRHQTPYGHGLRPASDRDAERLLDRLRQAVRARWPAAAGLFAHLAFPDPEPFIERKDL